MSVTVPDQAPCIAPQCDRTDTIYVDQEFAFLCARHAPEGLSWLDILPIASLDALAVEVARRIAVDEPATTAGRARELAEDIDLARERWWARRPSTFPR